jgi:N6-adenosine-specific RNA methylase IME4
MRPKKAAAPVASRAPTEAEDVLSDENRAPYRPNSESRQVNWPHIKQRLNGALASARRTDKRRYGTVDQARVIEAVIGVASKEQLALVVADRSYGPDLKKAAQERADRHKIDLTSYDVTAPADGWTYSPSEMAAVDSVAPAASAPPAVPGALAAVAEVAQSPAAIADALRALDRMEFDLKGANFERILKIRKSADAIKMLYREYKQVADRAGEVKIEADSIIGAQIRDQPKAEGAKGNPRGRGAEIVRSHDATTHPPTLAEIGVTKSQSSRLQRLADIPAFERKAAIKTLKADPMAQVTTAAMMRIVNREKREAHRNQIRARAAVFSADGPFATMVIDPPWPMEKIERDVRPNQAAFDYPTMTPEEIRQFWEKELRPRTEPDCHVFVCTTQKFLPVTFSLIEKCGVRYGFTMTWHKSGGFQPVDQPQYNSEFVVYGRIGSPLFIDTKNFPTCFAGESREHSRKPDSLYDIVRRVTAGPRLDVFSREAREGFAQFGNEIGKFHSTREVATAAEAEPVREAATEPPAPPPEPPYDGSASEPQTEPSAAEPPATEPPVREAPPDPWDGLDIPEWMRRTKESAP